MDRKIEPYKCDFCATPCGQDHCTYFTAEKTVKSHINGENHSENDTKERLLKNIRRLQDAHITRTRKESGSK